MPASSNKVRPKKATAGSNIRFGFETFKNVSVRKNNEKHQKGRAAAGAGGGKANTAGPGHARVAAVAAKEKASIATGVDWDAWLRIYQGLWGSGATDTDVRGALDGLSAWQQAALRRREPALFPPYAAATLELASVVMSASPMGDADDSAAAGPSSSSAAAPEVLVHAYAGGITRAVVELTERDSAAKAAGGRAGASTYRERAAAIDLPTEVTEVRNLAAHGRSPPLAQLRWAATMLLVHLRRDYWDAQRQQLGAVQDHQRRHADELKAKEEEKRLAAVDRAAAAAAPPVASAAAPAMSLDALRARLSGLAPELQSKATGGIGAPMAAPRRAPITTWA